MKNSSRFLLVVFFAALVFGSFVGCSKNETPSAPPSGQQELLLSVSHPQLQVAIATQNKYTKKLMEDTEVVGTGTGLAPDGKPAVMVLLKSDARISSLQQNLREKNDEFLSAKETWTTAEKKLNNEKRKLELFEEDRDVIDAAANRVMAYLKDLATGDEAAHSQKLLNEIAQARIAYGGKGQITDSFLNAAAAGFILSQNGKVNARLSKYLCGFLCPIRQHPA